jgi:hypothetical protein
MYWSSGSCIRHDARLMLTWCWARIRAEQAEEDVLGANVGVAEVDGFLGSEV